MTMVERVAMALREELKNIGYGVGTINAGQLSDVLARAAIEAMREPTDNMILEGNDVAGYENPQQVWEVMINAALKQPVDA